MDGTRKKGTVEPLNPALRSLLGGGPTSFLRNRVSLNLPGTPQTGPVRSQEFRASLPSRSPVAAQPVRLLGQPSSAMIGPTGGIAPSTPAAVQYRKCPGPIEMPDGRILEPDDYIRFEDLCEIMPWLLEAMGRAAGLSPGQPLTVVGGRPGEATQRVPGVPGFGPSQGPFGGGGGAMFGGGGAGSAGPQGQKGPQGDTGPQGPQGPGAEIKFAEKTDGDFATGFASFVPVPGTAVDFTTTVAGPVAFLAHVAAGDPPVNSDPNNIWFGIRVDGVDYRLTADFGGGTPRSADFTYQRDLTAGDHTAELIVKGVSTSDGFGVAVSSFARLMARTDIPLTFAVLFK